VDTAEVFPLDLTGAHGGTLAAAFGAGCVSTYAFIVGVLNAPLKKHITGLEERIANERHHCEQMETRLVHRIETLETILNMKIGGGPLRQDTQLALSEMRNAGDDK
jgi:hypothetical protein